MQTGRVEKPLVWLRGAIKTPPLSSEARLQAGFNLRLLQQGNALGMPHSRPMASIGVRCHELRIADGDHDWRVLYRVDIDAIVIADVFEKRTQKTPQRILAGARNRLREYDRIRAEQDEP